MPPSRLVPRLARDLETICLKCLHKDPQRRYATAEELADDLDRYREGKPIKARPTTVWERGLQVGEAASGRRHGPWPSAFWLFIGLTAGVIVYQRYKPEPGEPAERLGRPGAKPRNGAARPGRQGQHRGRAPESSGRAGQVSSKTPETSLDSSRSHCSIEAKQKWVGDQLEERSARARRPSNAIARTVSGFRSSWT